MATVCKTASYTYNGTTEIGALDSLATESYFLNYGWTHRFLYPSIVVVSLDDKDGQATQKYKHPTQSGLNWTTYLGSGRITIEEDGVKVFDGRILDGFTEGEPGTFRIVCVDWMSQLGDSLAHYDTREDLNGSGLRESTLLGDNDNSGSNRYAVYYAAGDSSLYDDTMSWTVDEWDGYHLVFSHKMAGSFTQTVFPHEEVVTASNAPMLTDTPANGEENLWEDDSNKHWMRDSSGDDYYVVYDFLTMIKSSLLSSLTSVELHLSGNCLAGVQEVGVYIYDVTNTTWRAIGSFGPTGSSNSWEYRSFNVPGRYLADIATSSGVVQIKLDVVDDAASGSDLNLFVYYLALEVTAEMTGEDTAYEIDSNGTNYVKIDSTDLRDIWQDCPYSIVDKISTHVNPLVTAYDPLKTLTTSVESTAKYLARHHAEQKPLAILRDWARSVGAVFWCKLDSGDPQVKWQVTWTPTDPAVNTLTDSDVLDWDTKREWKPVFNEYHLSGIRVGDSQLYYDTSTAGTDPGDDSKDHFGVTRAKFISNPGIYTEQDAKDVGAALVERDEDMQFILVATIAGLSSLRLGDHVEVTSTYLGISGVDYWVVQFKYDSELYETHLVLHPDSASDKFIEATFRAEDMRLVAETFETARDADRKTYPAPTWKETWT